MKNACKIFSVLSIGILGLTLSVSAQDVTTNDLANCVNQANAICTLSEDVTLNTGLNITNDNVTIDLNGHDITLTEEGTDGSSNYALTFAATDGTFTLKDSTGKGTVKHEGGRGVLVSEGDLTLEGVTVQSKDRALQVYAQTSGKKAKATLKSGKLETIAGSSKTRTVFLAGDNSTKEGAVFVMDGGEVTAPYTVKDSAAINIGNANSGGTSVVLNGGTVTGYNGIRLYGNGTDGMTVFTMNGGTVNAVGSGVIMSNSTGAENVDVYLYGGKIEAKDMEGQASVGGDAVAINQSQSGKLVIGKEDGTGPTLIGETGVAIKKGDVTINGGSIQATGEYREHPAQNDDGTEDTGAAISITTTGTGNDIKVLINDGNFISQNGNALYEGVATGRTDVTTSALSSLEVNGGNFVSPEGKDSVVAEKYADKFVTGGRFTSNVASYIDNENVSQSESGVVGDVHNISVTAENGSVTIPKNAAEGEVVSYSAAANEGYKLEKLVIKDADGNEIETKNNTFTMPGSDVTVTATFVELENPNTVDNVVTYLTAGVLSIIALSGSAVILKRNNW